MKCSMTKHRAVSATSEFLIISTDRNRTILSVSEIRRNFDIKRTAENCSRPNNNNHDDDDDDDNDGDAKTHQCARLNLMASQLRYLRQFSNI